MKVLFLGGAGMIGSAAAREAAARGIEVTAVTRSEPRRSLAPGVRHVAADARDLDALRAAVDGEQYDAVVNWIGFTPRDIAGHAELFGAIARQYVFISTCSVYARPVPLLPITESSPVSQPHFGYARDKIACEVELERAYREEGLPLTIVRPFHTYDRTVIPVLPGWTAIDRWRSGEPVVVHGDGTSLWTLMHSSDFARAFVPLLGESRAIGETVNVVSGEALTWDQIHLTLATAAGVRDPKLVHRSSETIGAVYPGWADVLDHDFRHTMLFDTSKLQRLVPGFAPQMSFAQGAREVMAYHDALPERPERNAELDAAFTRLVQLT
ncbi:SDR family oxidoreductase [Microbacterium aoyamense]|uniref:SDR family oxidoreductase n=1 Tax=Microbacterium aoyamense TaxID=344166 RepID=A0ABN2PWJ9_9MICO|nr:NAD-dependent epimerase/dehydratase family protein [Microbacterium aoyamense]